LTRRTLNDSQGEEMVVCRIDHYQTLTEVHVSIFAKKANKELSNIKFEESKVRLGAFVLTIC
jgi:hypothetical protein